MSAQQAAPNLDRSGATWIGTFPGLGRIEVAPDGGIHVEPESGDEDPYLRARALRYGWAEGLSWMRRGYTILHGAAVRTPEADMGVLLPGDAHDVAILITELVGRGWTVLGDRFTPVQWRDNGLLAFPREAPVLVANRRAQKAGLRVSRARMDSDARITEFPRATEATALVGVARVSARRPNEQRLVQLTGQERFRAATNMQMGGVFMDPRDVPQNVSDSMSRNLRYATIPQCEINLDPADAAADADALLSWFDEVREASR